MNRTEAETLAPTWALSEAAVAAKQERPLIAPPPSRIRLHGPASCPRTFGLDGWMKRPSLRFSDFQHPSPNPPWQLLTLGRARSRKDVPWDSPFHSSPARGRIPW